MDNKKRLHCHACGAELWPWEEVYSWEERGEVWVCEDCFDALTRSLTRRELASLLGSRVTTAEEVRGS